MNSKTKNMDARRKDARRNPLIEEMVSLGSQLASVRHAAGMTQAELASKVGTSAQALGQIEQGWRGASAVLLQRTARAVGARLVIVEEAVAALLERASAGRAARASGSPAGHAAPNHAKSAGRPPAAKRRRTG